MFFRPALAFFASLLLLACNNLPELTVKQLQTIDSEHTTRFFYPSAGGSVEAYLVRPRGDGPFPLLVLLHGHSVMGRGAIQVLSLAHTVAREACVAGLAISLPGYGGTEVNHDSIEEVTRRVVKDGLAIGKQLDYVDGSRMFFFGVSRGAIVAAAMINDVQELRGSVLYAGAYDLSRLYRDTSSFLVRKMLNPGGADNPPLMNLLREASQWRTPILILHGERDKWIPVNQALSLRDRLKAAGLRHRLVLFPDHGHFLPRADVRKHTVEFLKEAGAPACRAAAGF